MIYILGGKFNAAIEAAKVLKQMKIPLYVYVSKGEEKIKGLHSLREYALQEGIEVIQNVNIFKGKKIFFLSVECDTILKMDEFKEGSRFFNLHFSLLPKYRGTMTSFWPIIFREKETGVTLHEMDASIDTGPIIAQKAFPLREEYTCKDLYFKYHEVAAELLRGILPRVVREEYTSVPQIEIAASSFPRFLYNYFPKEFLSRDLKLMEKQDVYNILRALIFEEFQLPIVDGKKIKKVSLVSFDGFDFKIPTNNDYLYAKTID
ncbi:formyltransferase family protein [Anoxybacillus rupiensis]|uniref:Formyltransferase family protein n=1 Tax=Anoxybacteroides rupiense TaxID=311460 RepID=A0ABT5W6P1_9BACL|nr:formyltransferase family protein [Anoxybacillus rupiensis]MDE8564474.1 formyltransferase family protein [Anoxybacillus rupiensis]